MTFIPPAANTSSKGPQNLEARSWMRNRTGAESSSRTIVRFRACWVTHAESGWAVTPARCTLRLESSMKKRTYRVFSQTVSIVKKSQAMIPCACARRNSDQLGRSGGGPAPAHEPSKSAARCWFLLGCRACAVHLGFSCIPSVGSPGPNEQRLRQRKDREAVGQSWRTCDTSICEKPAPGASAAGFAASRKSLPSAFSATPGSSLPEKLGPDSAAQGGRPGDARPAADDEERRSRHLWSAGRNGGGVEGRRAAPNRRLRGTW